MRKKNTGTGSTGSSTMTILAIIVFLTIVFAGIAFLVNTSMIVAANDRTRFEVKKRLTEKAREALDVLYDDLNTREYDSLFSPVADYLLENEGSVSLRDVGSALNPNIIQFEFLGWIDTNLLPPPERLFIDPEKFNSNTIREFWQKTGLHQSLIPDYEEYFDKGTIMSFFTPYTYFNINLTDVFALEILYKLRGATDTEARSLRDKADQLVQAQVFINSNKDLETWATISQLSSFQNRVQGAGLSQLEFDKLFPIVNTEPQMNVHFIRPELLRALLRYDFFKIPDPAGKADTILARREDPEKKGLTKADLQNIIGLGLQYPGMRIYHYLGVFTNFWELKVSERMFGDEYALRWIIARIPKLKDTDEISYKIIEQTFSQAPVTDVDQDAVQGDKSGDVDEDETEDSDSTPEP